MKRISIGAVKAVPNKPAMSLGSKERSQRKKQTESHEGKKTHTANEENYWLCKAMSR